MSDLKLAEVSNEDLLNKLESAELFAEVMESENWKVFREAWRRIAAAAETKLAQIDPTDSKEILKLQYAIRFYRHVLESTVAQMHEVSDLAYHEAKERGLLNHFVEKVRARLSFSRDKASISR